ncbi:hypothetical protein [Aporhodopirellula aestuarii]|uniref:Secreted protein n=1 Tax=Aporhodopirellula aestuarii TaxID=2950107 RepID=A0ABT0TY15_9BACT|nr:hypothetical protein [Aporhodopirellula aestuarii]MCM2369430.1 hypothetical protein [Aporhodopirellula aestuarii]
MTQKNQRWVGAIFWVVVIVAGTSWMLGGGNADDEARAATSQRESPAELMLGSLWTRQASFAIADPTGIVRVGDVVFAPNAKDSQTAGSDATDDNAPDAWREIGYVTSVRQHDDSDNQLTVTVFESDAWSTAAAFTVHRNSGRLGDVLATMVPPQKREELQRKLTLAFETHADAVAREILPLVVESVQATVPLIETALREAIERHDEEIDALISRYREEIVRERIVPLVREEVLPIVQRHGQEPAESIGREVWNKASLWRFGWRAIYDKSPLPERELLVEEWRRFVDEEVIPIVEEHLDEIALAVENIFKDLAANERLREELSAVVGTIAEDPAARDLFRQILREAIVDNDRIREAWTGVWSSPEAKARLHRAGQRIEPILREIGDELMGTRRGGIEPGFARVLRNQILAKDRTWITITPGEGDLTAGQPIRLQESKRFMPYPVVYVVKKNNL